MVTITHISTHNIVFSLGLMLRNLFKNAELQDLRLHIT